MMWLCVQFPLLPLNVFVRCNSRQNKQPLLVAELNRVCCLNAAASDAGIVVDQSLSTAMAVAEQVGAVERDIKKERRALDQLASWFYQFSPMVSLKPPNAILLDIAGSLKLFNGLENLQEQITGRLSKLGYSHRQGLGKTPKAAWLFARCPDRQDIKSIPLRFLDIDKHTLAALGETGFSSLGEVMALPTAAIGKRFGAPFVDYLQKVTGERRDLQRAITIKKSFHSELFYIDGMETIQALLFPIKRLLSELCQYLQSHQLHCQRFVWYFKPYRGKDNKRVFVELSQSQNNHAVFMSLTEIKLQQLILKEAIHSVVLYAGDLVVMEVSALTLFKHDSWENTLEEPLPVASPHELLDKLKARLGTDAVYGVQPKQEHVPEIAWSKIAPATQLTSSPQNQPAELAPPCPCRPGWLLPQPIMLKEYQHKPYWHGVLELIRGPERIDNRWWQQPVQRDYFIARHQQGQLCWVFRDMRSKRWFLHGLFG